MSTFAISAAKFVLPGATMQGGYLTIEDGKFAGWMAEKPACEVVEYPGAIVGPGLVDTHIHGFHNHATTDCDPAAIDDASVALAKSGTTTWLPTTFTESVEDIGRACAAIAQADEARSEDYVGAHIGGIFLEGPFFTTAHVGAQNPSSSSIPRSRSSMAGRSRPAVASLRARLRLRRMARSSTSRRSMHAAW